MKSIIWLGAFAFFGFIFRSIILEARKPAPPPDPPKAPPPPPIFNFNTQMNVEEHYHTHNTMNVTVIKAEPKEN
jgi:hypothetical protein